MWNAVLAIFLLHGIRSSSISHRSFCSAPFCCLLTVSLPEVLSAVVTLFGGEVFSWALVDCVFNSLSWRDFRLGAPTAGPVSFSRSNQFRSIAADAYTQHRDCCYYSCYWRLVVWLTSSLLKPKGCNIGNHSDRTDYEYEIGRLFIPCFLLFRQYSKFHLPVRTNVAVCFTHWHRVVSCPHLYRFC